MDSPAERLTEPGGLAEQLHRLRKAAGLTGEILATQLGWARSKVSKLENGRQLPSEDDIKAWTTACGGDASTTRKLLEQLVDVTTEHRQWRHLQRSGQAEVQAGIDELVRQATAVRNFEVLIIPGLLQTAGYARHRVLENVRVHGFDLAEVDTAVASRIRRQDVLHTSTKQFRFVILEAALRTRLCPPDVMAGQLDRLLGLDGMPNVSFGVLPTSVDLPVAPLHGFLQLDDLTIVETFASSIRLRGEEADVYDQIMRIVGAAAVDGDDARRLILEAARDLPR